LKEPLRQQLSHGLKQMGLYYPVEMQQKLVHYIQLIARWNKIYNLTAIRDVEEMVSKHLLDSLAIQPYIEGKTILDVGSGAGLPGIPLAITSPEKCFVLLDSNGKKTRFLTQVKIDLKLDNIEIVHSRVQEYRPTQRPCLNRSADTKEAPASGEHGIYFDVITSRAYASTDDILSSTAHLQDENTCILVMQGKLDDQFNNENYQLLESHRVEVYGLNADRHLLEFVKRSH
jgi:16S rRNA (guanine527-N7)-methyltransferase